MDKGVLIVDTPPTPLNGEEVDDEHESDDGGDLTLLEEDDESREADARDLEGGGATQEQVARQRSGDRKKKLKKPTCTTTLVGGTQIVGGVRRSTRVSQLLEEWWKNHIFSKDKDAHQANVALAQDPTTLGEALKCEDASKWEAAMEDEYHSLLANGTWELTILPKDRKAVGCKWVFKTKRDASGEVVRHKARLVARGFS